MVNGSETPDLIGETTQEIKCGAAVHLTPEVFEHGIVFLHPNLPLFKLFLEAAPNNKLNHRFEVCKPLFPEIKRFAIHVIPGAAVELPGEVADPKPTEEEAPKSTLIMP